MMRQFAVALIVVGQLFASPGAMAGVQRDLTAVLAEEGLIGGVWALVNLHFDEGLEDSVRLGAAGFQDGPARQAMVSDTRVQVGSLTKSVLATGVLRLVTLGELELDAPVSQYLSEPVIANPWRHSAPVTVRHLLDHTAGLGDAYFWQLFSEHPQANEPLQRAFPNPAIQLAVRARPGSRLSYSNMGYTLLGLLIEAVTGQSYEDYLAAELLAPLKMQHSTFSFVTQQGEGADPHLAWGHIDDGSRYAAQPMYLRPAGQFTTTVADLALFARFLLSDGRIDGERFIAEYLMRARGIPHGTLAAEGGLVAGYSLGLGRRDRNGVVGFCHGGNVLGFVAKLCVFPDQQTAYVYAINTDSETADYERVDRLLIDALGVADAQTANEAHVGASVEQAEGIDQWFGRYVLSPNRFRSFEYLDNLFGAVTVSALGNGLNLTSLQGADRALRHVGARVYSADDRSTASHVFVRGLQGEYLFSTGFSTYEKVDNFSFIAHWVSLLSALTGLTWIVVCGIPAWIRQRGRREKSSMAPALLSLLLLLVPVPLFFAQSFMALGDVTIASVALAVATALLPVGVLITLGRALSGMRNSWLARANALAAVAVLQWCVVLFFAGLLPLRLWA